MRVFLLGAGASKSYDQSPTGQRMPIARDFFSTFDQLSISANPWVLIEGLIGYLQHNCAVADVFTYLRSGIDIEDLHSEIEQARDTGLASGDAEKWFFPYRAYNELVFLFSSVLNEIQNGPVSRPHVRLIEQLAPDDVLVTFNWDTLLDRALAERTQWRPDWGYTVVPRTLFNDGWREPIAAPPHPGNRLIKLHGSTNWLTGFSITDGEGTIIPSQDLNPAAFAVFESATFPYDCFAGRYMEGYEPYSYGYYPPNLDFPAKAAPDGYVIVSIRPKLHWREGSAGDGGLTSMPLLIPPVKHKSYTFFGDLFRALWTEAEHALASADEIVIIGYSFPRTDVQSDQLFRRAFARREKMPKVVILDPQPHGVVDKMIRDFGIDRDYVTVDPVYFTSDYDFNRLIS